MNDCRPLPQPTPRVLACGPTALRYASIKIVSLLTASIFKLLTLYRLTFLAFCRLAPKKHLARYANHKERSGQLLPVLTLQPLFIHNTSALNQQFSYLSSTKLPPSFHLGTRESNLTDHPTHHSIHCPDLARALSH